MKKELKICVAAVVAACLCVPLSLTVSVNATPPLPVTFVGTIQDRDGVNLSSGTVIIQNLDNGCWANTSIDPSLNGANYLTSPTASWGDTVRISIDTGNQYRQMTVVIDENPEIVSFRTLLEKECPADTYTVVQWQDEQSTSAAEITDYLQKGDLLWMYDDGWQTYQVGTGGDNFTVNPSEHFYVYPQGHRHVLRERA